MEQHGHEPETYQRAVTSAAAAHWHKAMDEEIQSLKENHTWDLVDLPPGRSALRGKWVYKLKRGPDGRIVKHKARWVVKGFEQQFGIDYDQTFAAVVKPMSYKVLFSLAAQYGWEIEQMDSKPRSCMGNCRRLCSWNNQLDTSKGRSSASLTRPYMA
jgi:hypothetical protein